MKRRWELSTRATPAMLKGLIERDEISQQQFDRAVRSAGGAVASHEAAVATVAESQASVTAAESRLMQARNLAEQAEADKAEAEANQVSHLRTEIREALERREKFNFSREEMLTSVAKQNGVPIERVRELAAA